MKRIGQTLATAGILATSLLSLEAYSEEMTNTKTAPVEASVSVDFASSYIFRGFTLNENPTVQPGVELSFLENAVVGVWGALPLDPTDEEVEQEIDVYASYTIPAGIAAITLGATEYMYPETEGAENDREIMISVALETLLNPTLSAFAGIEGAIEDTEYYEFGLSEDVFARGDLSFNLGGTLGYLDVEEGKDGLAYGMVTLAASYKIINASANFIIETDDEVNSLEEQEDFYVSVGTGYTF